MWSGVGVGCAQHGETAVVDPSCDECVLADRASQWVEWFDARLALLDAQAALIADDLQVVTASRDEIAEALEHGGLDRDRLTALVAPFAVPPPLAQPATVRAAAVAVHPTSAGVPLPGAHGAASSHPLSPAALLSAAGATLLLLAAVVFVAVSWDRLGTGGQVTVMVTATVVAAAASVTFQRRGLRWTAEALSWLAASLAVVDVVAAAGFDLILADSAPEVVVAVASLAVLVVGLVVAMLTNASDEVHGAVEGSSGSIVTDVRAHLHGHALVGPWVQGPLAVVTGVGALAVRLGELRWAPVTAAVASLLLVGSLRVRPALRRWWAAPALVALVVSVLVSFGQIDGSAVPLIYAATVSLLVVSLGAWAYRCRTDPRSVPVGSVSSLLVVFVLPLLHVARCDTRAQVVIVVALGLAAVLASLAPVAPTRRAVAAATGAPLIGASLATLDSASTGALALALLTVVCAAWLRHADGRRMALVIGTASGLALVGYAGAAAGLAVAWAAAAAAEVAVIGATGVMLWMSRRTESTRPNWLSAVALVAAIAAALATAISTATLPAFEMVAFTVTVAGVAVTTMVSDAAVRWVSLGVAPLAFGAGWLALLSDGGVDVAEAYSVPIGVAWCAAGLVALHRGPSLRTWPTLGPGVVMAGLPTVGQLSGGDPGLTRMLLLLVVGAAVAVAAGSVGYQAPLVLGVGASIFAAFTQVAPWASGLPRWLSLGAVGIALLVAGARFESVRAGTRRATQRITRLR